MKILLCFCLSVIAVSCFAQKKGYGYIAAGAAFYSGGSTYCGSAGLGSMASNRFSAGGVVHYYEGIASLHADVRAHFKALNKTRPFISFQPGMIIVPTTGLKNRFSFNILAGAVQPFGKAGLYTQLGLMLPQFSFTGSSSISKLFVASVGVYL